MLAIPLLPGNVTPQNPGGLARLRLVRRHLHRQAVDCHHDQRYQMRIPQLLCAVAIGSSEIVAAEDAVRPRLHMRGHRGRRRCFRRAPRLQEGQQDGER